MRRPTFVASSGVHPGDPNEPHASSSLLVLVDPAMAHVDSIPAAGEVLADKYRIEHVLGQGGMGIVHAAMHLHLDERVAIKFLLPELAQDPALVARFLREGRASIKIRSEHVVRVLDVATMAGGTPYMVMEYLEGTNLEDLIENGGPLPVQVAVDHLLQATEAIAEAHALGMVHRDLKPANLFLSHRADGSPCVKVLDFGITKILDPKGGAELDVTNVSVVMGSPRYMSPEQMRSTRPIDPRADIWALGVILHELVTGVPPFDGATMTDLLASILQDAPIPLSRFLPDAPPALAAVLARCLEKDPDARYGDIADLSDALAPLGSHIAQTSADRVSRVIRQRASTTKPPAIIPSSRAALVSASTIPPPPSSTETLTISATANISPMSNAANAAPREPPPRSAARAVAVVVAGAFFTLFVVVTIVTARGTAATPGASRAAAAERPPSAATLPGASGRAGASFEPAEAIVELSPPPMSAVSAPGEPATAGPLASRHATPSSKLHTTAPTAPASAAPGAAPPGPTPSPLRADGDLFDGRK